MIHLLCTWGFFYILIYIHIFLHINNCVLSTRFEYINTIYSLWIFPLKSIHRLILYYNIYIYIYIYIWEKMEINLTVWKFSSNLLLAFHKLSEFTNVNVLQKFKTITFQIIIHISFYSIIQPKTTPKKPYRTLELKQSLTLERQLGIWFIIKITIRSLNSEQRCMKFHVCIVIKICEWNLPVLINKFTNTKEI